MDKDRLRYSISPLRMGMSTTSPELFTPQAYSPNVLNGRIEQNSFRKRWGYSLDRTLNNKVYAIFRYPKVDGTCYTMFLTSKDLCVRKTTASNTYQYVTQTYATGSATVSADGLTVTGSGGANFTTAGVAANDYFILDADHSSSKEDDADWTTVASKDSDTQLTLSSAYPGTKGAAAAGYKVRKVYTVAKNHRWSWCIIKDTLCFGNQSVGVHYWDGSGYATELYATADRAKFMVEYGNRLVLANLYISGLLAPCTIKWSKENDPTDWTDSTAGENDFQDTGNPITGLANVGNSLIVFRHDSYIVGNRTGVATSPFAFPTHKSGVGCVAPYSIVPFMGRAAWLGRDDFYTMNGDTAEPITSIDGSGVRDKFFGAIEYSDIQNVFGYHNPNLNEIYWTGVLDGRRQTYAWNYKTNQWTIHEYADQPNTFGIGTV